jgi:hypothetical protein
LTTVAATTPSSVRRASVDVRCPRTNTCFFSARVVAHISTFELTQDCCEMDRYELVCCEEVHELVQKIVWILPYKTKQAINIFTIESTQTTTHCCARVMVHNITGFASEAQNPNPSAFGKSAGV